MLTGEGRRKRLQPPEEAGSGGGDQVYRRVGTAEAVP